MEIPFWILKKVVVIRELKYDFAIDEDGYGWTVIDDHRITFEIDQYGDVIMNTIKFVV